MTLVDFKAGFEDSARGATTSLDGVIVVVDPTSAALRLAVHMRDLVRAVKAGGLPATRHLDSPALVEIANQLFRNARISYPAIVLNRITDRAMEDYLRTELASDGITPVGTLREDPALSRAWLQGAALPVTAAAADAERIAAVLETIAAAPLSAA